VEPSPNRQATRFNAEVAEGFAKGSRGKAFSAGLLANLGVLCVKEIFAEHDEVGR
jgi:HD-like signal output (HDOD) protein